MPVTTSIASISSKSNRWYVIASIGLGFCLSSMEAERYTALWNFGTRSPAELLSITLFSIAVVSLFIAFKKQGQILYSKMWLVLIIGIVQEVGYVVACTTPVLSPAMAIVFSVARQSCLALFLLYIEYNLEMGTKKSLISLSLGLIITGAIQISILIMPRIAALVVAGSAPLLASVLLCVSVALRTENAHRSEMEDSAIEAPSSISDGRKPFFYICLSLLLLNVLLIDIHSWAMAQQDGGTFSSLIQFSSGLGTATGGLIFLCVLRSLSDADLVRLLRIIVLPLVLITLCIPMLTGGSTSPLYLILLGVCYSILLLFIWVSPRYSLIQSQQFIGACVAYLFYKLGWAIGILAIMIVPQSSDRVASTYVIIACFLLLIAISTLEVIESWRSSEHNQSDPAVTEHAFLEACGSVSGHFGLSPRETEVLPLLGRGRNAKFIAEALVISDGTARTHIMHIYRKLGINSQQELIDMIEQEMLG